MLVTPVNQPVVVAAAAHQRRRPPFVGPAAVHADLGEQPAPAAAV
jgi:hypothetical protein